jgi:hypothetical protein
MDYLETTLKGTLKNGLSRDHIKRYFNQRLSRAIWGKYRNIFFSEAIALIEPKVCINHWKALYKLCVFYVDRNSKVTTEWTI